MFGVYFFPPFFSVSSSLLFFKYLIDLRSSFFLSACTCSCIFPVSTGLAVSLGVDVLNVHFHYLKAFSYWFILYPITHLGVQGLISMNFWVFSKFSYYNFLFPSTVVRERPFAIGVLGLLRFALWLGWCSALEVSMHSCGDSRLCGCVLSGLCNLLTFDVTDTVGYALVILLFPHVSHFFFMLLSPPLLFISHTEYFLMNYYALCDFLSSLSCVYHRVTTCTWTYWNQLSVHVA